MRKKLLMLMILICGCSTKQESKLLNTDSAISIVEPQHVYDSLSTKECEHLNLSKSFNIKVNFKRYKSMKEEQDSCIVKLFLTNKITKKLVDSISILSHFYFSDTFMDCKNVLSYSTRQNIEKDIVDNYYGDIVIADLNFDNKEDIAVINDSGGNGGTFYSYFIQTPNQKFIPERFLTDSMIYFPTKIDYKTKTLVTYVHASVCEMGENIYQLDKNTGKWDNKAHKLINVCNK
ncbi:XAC2610-related protein [Xanthocytophaga agilis]|uniref:Lipoprotein n=1 Tax=Xanthocytophaga agilis TaxID=3048010 RepID=A0AAE3UEA5_9BACT|nr:hypothetical protein [Xanthocytophaga agilis]MDJ1500042.1 hypothetical protein [Xanthocytophaga agilis]